MIQRRAYQQARAADQSRDRKGALGNAGTWKGILLRDRASHAPEYATPFSSANRRSFTVAALNAFTIVELIVSMGILTATMIAVAAVFSISSDAAGRTEAHAEVLEASAAFQQTVADELSHIVPDGLLIIESPPPTLVRREVPDGPQMFRLRHDRLVFISSKGTEGAYQSFTDPTRGDPIVDPTKAPVSSPEALIYCGPGIPVAGNGTATGIRRPFDNESIGLTATEWVFAHRAILLMLDAPNPANPAWTPPDMTAFNTGLLTNSPAIFEAQMDVLVSSASDLATPATLAAKLVGLSLATPPAQLSDLWQPNLTPVTTSLTDPADADYFTRSGFTFQPRMVDFRIEWTDGRRVDPDGADNMTGTVATDADNDWRTRWFGLAPDPTELPDVNSLDAMKYQARTRFAVAGNPSNPDPANPDNPAVESTPGYFSNPIAGDGIEWAEFGVTPNAMARYRAVWRRDTWQYRPKALRFTYRIYDATRRLKQPTTTDFDEDGVADLDAANNTFIVTRYGQEFSIVVPLP